MKYYRSLTILATLWILSGLTLGMALNPQLEIPWLFPTILFTASGFLALSTAMRNAQRRRLLLEGPSSHESGSLLVGLLWIMPISFLLFGVIWWSIAMILF